ncbi:MAG: InlB B-repeat-containing protein [Pseudoalteromonas prydzensis]|uniref:InlB B-repeat-containing protein n=1 Tax=Pseudoalteromonas prydzensis TaxID=182141 RepID=UPI003F99C545
MNKSVLLVLCTLLTACGGSDDNKKNTEQPIQSYTISTDVKGEGQLQPTSLVLKQGESGTFELQPSQGHKVASVEGCNGTYSNNNYTIESATQSCQVTATFEPQTINVALETDAYISLYADKTKYVYGDSAVINYELSSGYLLDEITGCNGVLSNELYKVDTLTTDCQVKATTLPTSQVFSSEDEEQINVTVLNDRGSILPSSKGIIELSNPELPALDSTLEFERDLLGVDIATEAGQTIELQITYENPLPAQFTYQKQIAQQWQALDQDNITVSDDRLTLTLTLTDGGAGDSDGVINGVIKDPGGPAVIRMHSVTVNQSVGGAITPESLAVAHGDTALFTITTDAGHTIESVTGCNGTLNGTSYQTAAITQNCEVSAEFTLMSFLVTAQAGEGGQISPLEQLATYGDTVTFTVTADDGHNIESVQGCDGLLTGNIYTTAIIISACEVRATFDPQTVLVTAQAGAGGSISPMSQQLNVGQQTSLTVTPDEGYGIANVTGCNGSLNGNTYTTGAVTANCQVQASFSLNSYTVSASADEGGTVNPATQNVNHGSSAQITITPNEGYSIDAVTGCNGSLNGNTYTTGVVTANCQVQASFSINSYSVRATASEGGTVNPATQNVNQGSNAQITITANEGYSIDAVTGCNGSLNGNTYTTSAVTANCQVQVSFSINSYSVRATASEGGTVNPATQNVNQGSNAQITITPNEGYNIDAVTGCNGSLNGNTYTTSAVTANCQVQASFSINSYTVSASAGEGGNIKPSHITAKGGSEVIFEFSVLSGFNLLDIKGCGGEVVGNNFIINSLSESCDLVFEFVPVEMESIVEVNTENITLEPKGLFLINDTNSKELKSALTTNIATESEQQKLVMLTTEFGEPMLLGIKHKGDKSIELSVESSAYVFIITSSYLYGVEFSDTKILFSRFKQHSRFAELEEELIKKINNDSPCPMDSLCNFRASIIAEQIAKETTIDDLISKE